MRWDDRAQNKHEAWVRAEAKAKAAAGTDLARAIESMEAFAQIRGHEYSRNEGAREAIKKLREARFWAGFETS